MGTQWLPRSPWAIGGNRVRNRLLFRTARAQRRAVGGGCCRLQMLLRLALAPGGQWLGALKTGRHIQHSHSTPTTGLRERGNTHALNVSAHDATNNGKAGQHPAPFTTSVPTSHHSPPWPVSPKHPLLAHSKEGEEGDRGAPHAGGRRTAPEIGTGRHTFQEVGRDAVLQVDVPVGAELAFAAVHVEAGAVRGVEALEGAEAGVADGLDVRRPQAAGVRAQPRRPHDVGVVVLREVVQA